MTRAVDLKNHFQKEMAAALREDRSRRDRTSVLFVPAAARGKARLVARAPGVLSGVYAAATAFHLQDKNLRARALVPDGRPVRPGQAVLAVEGPLRSLLSAERTALNTLSHLSGIATLTHRYVRAVGPRGPLILDTRKTLPGLRDMQKYAVRCGGGVNHRRDLSSAVLVKENHLAFFQGAEGRALFGRRVAAAHRRGLAVQVECRNRGEARWALEAGADLLLLDNISLRSLRGLVGWIREESRRLGRVAPGLEVSGGVTLATVGAIARAGVDRISIGRLTHSASGLDMNMDVVSA